MKEGNTVGGKGQHKISCRQIVPNVKKIHTEYAVQGHKLVVTVFNLFKRSRP